MSNKLLEIEQPTVNYTLKAYPKQLEFIKSPVYISLFCAGIGCVSAETLIEGVPIADRNQPSVVTTMLGESLGSQGYLKGRADLYRVKTELGLEVVATLQHRFLTSVGWSELASLAPGSIIGVDGGWCDRSGVGKPRIIVPGTNTSGDIISSIDFVKNGDYYDLQVPYYEHYSAQGIWHHNSGKTHAGAIKTLLYCMANPGSWGMVTAPYMKMLENSTIPTYLKVFPNEFIYKIRMKPHPELETTNGCKLFFWSTDKPETIAGVELAFAHMDETSLSPEAAYVNIKKRLRQRDETGKSYPYQIWMSTTPRQLNWLYKEIIRPDSVIKVFTGSTMDNKYLENREDYIKNTGLIPGSKQYEQEIEGKFVLLTGDCLFNQDTLDNILLDCMEPLETRDEGTTRIWKKPVVGGRYVAGADCADEGGGGVNDLIIIDWSTGEEVAEINADVAADRFAMMAFSLLREYGNPLVAVERNANAGGVVTTKLQDMGYSNLYKDRKGRIGWYTMANGIGENVNRFTMLLEYEEAVRLRQTVVRSTDAVGEMSTLVRDEGGRYKPRSGCRSDRVMARAICWQMKKEKPRTGKGGFKTFRRIAVI